MKLPILKNVGFGVDGIEVDGVEKFDSGKSSFRRFGVGSSLIPAFLLISARASDPIFFIFPKTQK